MWECRQAEVRWGCRQRGLKWGVRQAEMSRWSEQERVGRCNWQAREEEEDIFFFFFRLLPLGGRHSGSSVMICIMIWHRFLRRMPFLTQPWSPLTTQGSGTPILTGVYTGPVHWYSLCRPRKDDRLSQPYLVLSQRSNRSLNSKP